MNPLAASPATVNSPLPKSASRRIWWGVGIGVLVVSAVAVGLYVANGRKTKENGADQSHNGSGGTTVTVQTVHPQLGGIDRISIQPGTVEPFESADLYAKVSGFLVETVDIGKRVKKGDVLARISVPEYEKQVKKDEASVDHANAKVKQMEAHLRAAKAEAKAAEQFIVQAKITMRSKEKYKDFRLKALERIKALVKDDAESERTLEEFRDNYEAAFEAENAAREGVTTAQLKSDAAAARVDQAEADIDDAKAEVKVAEAELGKSKVELDYTIILSPYDGVVTKRNFNTGDFIRSADAGGGDRKPVVAVDRTDLMRVVVQVPDRDVPYVDVGDTATIEIDALDGRVLKGVIARSAEAEDSQTRTMRVEIDILNTDGKLRRNMYGRVKLNLQVGSPTALRIPSVALVHKAEGERAMVRVLRDHRVHLVPVGIGIDTGVEVEVLRGLKQTDLVILKANGPLEEGTEVAESNVDGPN
jgi:HlyD family secretion protein